MSSPAKDERRESVRLAGCSFKHCEERSGSAPAQERKAREKKVQMGKSRHMRDKNRGGECVARNLFRLWHRLVCGWHPEGAEGCACFLPKVIDREPLAFPGSNGAKEFML